MSVSRLHCSVGTRHFIPAMHSRNWAELCSIWPRADLFMTMFSRVFASRSNTRLRPTFTANSHITKTGLSPDERFNKLTKKAHRSLYVPHSDHYIYRTVVTICTTQWSLYVPHSGHYMYRTAVTICTAQRSLYVPHSGHYMYRQFTTHKFYVLPTQLYLCVLCGSENKQRLFPYTTLTDWVLKPRQCFYCAVRTGF